MQVSVLIATRDRPLELRRCVESIARQTYAVLEVIIIDDASTHPLDEEDLRQAAADLTLRFQRTDQRLGPIGCRNLLMQQARGDVFAVLDDDAYFADTQGIERAIAAFSAHPGCGILAFRIVERLGDKQRLLVPHGRRRLRRRPHLADQEGLAPHYLAGGHALRRSVVDRSGYFSDGLFYGHEELDLSYRALDAGFTIRYVPDVQVYHVPGGSSPTRMQPWKLHYLMRNRILIACRYLPWPYLPVHLVVWIAWYGLAALRGGALWAYWRALSRAIASIPRLDRRPLRERTVVYLKAHGGRLWC